MHTTKITYYWIYIIIATLVSSITLFYLAKAIPELIPDDNLTKETLMCSGQILWQGMILLVFIKKNVTRYLYQMITVSLLGSLALIPLIIWHEQTLLTLETRVGFFFIVVFCMILDHFRRVKKLELPFYLTATWVLYRILWLPILLF